MKFFFLVLLSFSCSFLYSQIQNKGFSEWENFDSYEKPKYWHSTQDSTFGSNIYRKESLDEIWLEFNVDYQESNRCFGKIWQNFSKEELANVNGISFDTRSNSINSDSTTFLRIIISYFTDGNSIDNEIITIHSIQKEFTQFNIALKEIETDSLHLSFTGGGNISPFDGCIHESIVELDNICFTTTTPMTNFLNENINIFPNPTTNTIRIEGALDFNNHYNIYNSQGQILLKTKLDTEIDISFLPKGIYYLTSDNNSFVSFIKI